MEIPHYLQYFDLSAGLQVTPSPFEELVPLRRKGQMDVLAANYYPPFKVFPSKSGSQYSPHGGKQASKRLYRADRNGSTPEGEARSFV